MYREDIVTVALRAVSVSSGRVLTSATTTKTIYSVQWQAGVFRYVAVDEILEYETGFSRNEPEIFATREAMELAVLSMIVEGASDGQWAFADANAGEEVLQSYRRRYELGRLGYTFKEVQEMDAQTAEAETEVSRSARLHTQASAVDVGTKGGGEDRRLMRAALQLGPR
jgi:curli production assembly/transport component CsgG